MKNRGQGYEPRQNGDTIPVPENRKRVMSPTCQACP